MPDHRRFIAQVEPTAFRNPVLDRDFPDPSICRVNGWYYAYATNTRGVRVQAARSADLIHWEYLGEVLPTLPDWAVRRNGLTWSPNVVQASRESPFRFLMYYVTRFAHAGNDGMQAIGLAGGRSPEGPFTPLGDRPFLIQEDEGGSIDPAVFQDEDGSRHLLWKNDGNALRRPTYLYIQRLCPDGLALDGRPQRLLQVDLPWEGQVVEAPAMWKHCGQYFLFYSANDWTTPRYAIGAAVAPTPFGPFRKLEQPVLATDYRLGLVGPGGQDLVCGPDSECWMVFHTWTPGRYRALNLARLSWPEELPRASFS